jgi:zinc transport system substrate-binding protein
MKKIKYLLPILLISILMVTGCFKRDNLEGIEIITTTYPIEFATNYLYGEHSIVNSIYPDGTDTFTYKLSEKQLNDYSKKKLFIYNRATNDKDIAVEFLKRNANMLIIDATYGMEITYGEEELWLNPSNLLMMTQNIKNGLQEYMTNSYLEKEIDKKYEEIKVTLSELDANLKLTAENASRKKIVVNSDSLKYLEKYGFEVISLDSTNEAVSDKTISSTIDSITNGEVKHIFLLENNDNSDAVKQVIDKTNVETYTFRRLDNIKEEDRDENNDYFTIMNSNIELLRNELY